MQARLKASSQKIFNVLYMCMLIVFYKQESVTFDPFMSMSMPIPGKLCNLSVFIIPSNPRHLPTKVQLMCTYIVHGDLTLIMMREREREREREKRKEKGKGGGLQRAGAYIYVRYYVDFTSS